MKVIHIIVAMKPPEGNYASNALNNKVAGLNIDESRVGTESTRRQSGPTTFGIMNDDGWKPDLTRIGGSDCGRWPANIIHDGSTEIKEIFPETRQAGNRKESNLPNKRAIYGEYTRERITNPKINGDKGGSAARFFKECKE